MNRYDIDYQVSKLVVFVEKGGCKTFWMNSKGFSMEDREAISEGYEEHMRAKWETS